MAESLIIPVAHDYNCPWCWIAYQQIKRLKVEFPDVDYEWKAFELMPEELEWSASTPPKPEPDNKPPVLSRFHLALYASNVTLPKVEKPKRMRTFNAHNATEFAKDAGLGNQFAERLYLAYYEEGRNINEVDVLIALADGLIEDIDGLKAAIESRSFGDRIVHFDEQSYSQGIYNVPTFFVGDDRLAEQPYAVVRDKIAEYRTRLLQIA